MPKFEELSVGQQVAQADYKFTRDSLVRYAGASGDFNTIHYRDDIAQAVGLPGVLAHGMLTMGVSVQPVVTWLGDAGKVLDYQVRFTKPVVVPPKGSAKVSVTATIAALDQESRRARVDLTTSFEENNVLGKAQVWVQL
ncbi:MAG: acyl dehydratase [Actinobacteria bacterium]|nr:acyl dehydratase [Actinomycetota bacterium]